MKPRQLQGKVRHFPILASMLGKRFGIEVVFQGEQPSNDGKRIVLPALPEDLTEEDMKLLTGFLDHEAGAHGQHMDFDAWCTDHNDGIARTIKNILCDVRDERMLGRDYPGCRENLREMLEILDRRGRLNYGADTAPSAFLGWLYHVVRSANGQFIKALQEHPEAVRKFLSETCLARVEFEALKAIDEPETAGVVLRTSNILRILQEEKENPPPPLQQGKSNQPGNGSGGEKEENSGAGGGSAGDAEAQDDSVSKSGAGNKPRCDPEENNDDHQPGGNQDNEAEGGDEAASNGGASKSGDDPGAHGGKSGDPDNDGTEPDKDTDEVDQSTISGSNENTGNKSGGNDDADDQTQHDQFTQWTREQIEEILDAAYDGVGDLGKILGDEIEEAIASRGAGPQGCEIPGVAEFEKTPTEVKNLDSLRQTTAQLRGRSLALIQASRYKPASTALIGRRLDRRILARVATGNMRIFERREPREAVNTAIVILGDSSGSMAGDKADMAFQGAYISSEAMKSIPGTATLVAAYPANAGESADLGILKGWTENSKPVQPVADGHWTPIAEALQWARVQLAFRRETRKIVLILTDGESSDDSRARKAVEDLEADSIELIAIGILCDSAQNWTSRYRQIDDIKELPAAMIEMLREQLIENRRLKRAG
jgi:cobalamin biosynthesis protein CobT